MNIDLTEDWSAVLGRNHPALNSNGTLKEEAANLLLAPRLPSRIASHPSPDALGVDDPVRNTELFLRIADHVEMFPETYNQEVWGDDIKDEEPHLPACGTAFCIAGHASHETGWKPRKLTNSYNDRIDIDYAAESHPEAPHAGLMTASTIGAYELGLTTRESSFLFDESWLPRDGMTVPQALRALAWGATVLSVSDWDEDEYEYEGEVHPLETEDANRETIRCTGNYGGNS